MGRLTLILPIILSSSFAHAQTAAPAPTGLAVGSGNYFSPIVADLEKAIAFYGAIGFQFHGEPSTADANPQLRAMVVVQDPAGRFTEIVQPEKLTEAQAAATGNVVGVRVRFKVGDVESALKLYRDTLGFHELTPLGQYSGDAGVLDALGLTSGQYRVGQLQVPASGLQFTLIDFKGVERKTKLAGIKDPGSTRECSCASRTLTRRLQRSSKPVEHSSRQAESPSICPRAPTLSRSVSCAIPTTCSSS
jgi:catechol 2,3-dioxygenase-like lactoylglutathione lyase family enzyme